MTAHVTLTLELSDRTIADLRTRVDNNQHTALREIQTLLKGGQLGAIPSYARWTLCSATASKAITASASGGAPADTLVIGGTTLTNAASPANEDEFADAATDALLAASVVSCINAHSVLSKIVFAVVTTSASGIFTIYSKYPGPIGNLIALAETGSGFSIAGGATALSGGSGDEVDGAALGYNPSAALDG